MKYVPLESFLGKPLTLHTGEHYSRKEVLEAASKFSSQFKDIVEEKDKEILRLIKLFEEYYKKTNPYFGEHLERNWQRFKSEINL